MCLTINTHQWYSLIYLTAVEKSLPYQCLLLILCQMCGQISWLQFYNNRATFRGNCIWGNLNMSGFIESVCLYISRPTICIIQFKVFIIHNVEIHVLCYAPLKIYMHSVRSFKSFFFHNDTKQFETMFANMYEYSPHRLSSSLGNSNEFVCLFEV